ncbi:MAG TPA: hypothetical protein DCS93_28415 [Microscillaceae bacterium]|nr:hypothetical protein [Microscillaceae bacterium]
MPQAIYLILTILIGTITPLMAQEVDSIKNLVPNPSFEYYFECPEHLEAIRFRKIPFWVANPGNCTPDYFNECGRRGYRVPKNRCGTMPAKSGHAYVGMILRVGHPEGDPMGWYYREHITVKLKHPLKKNFRYVAQMYVALSTYANYAIANIGMLFTPTARRIKWNTFYEAQVVTPRSKLLDKANRWVLVRDTIVAKGGETFLTIGEFNTLEHSQIKRITDSRKHRKKFNFNRAYYYIDDVAVVELGKVMIDTLPRITIQQKPPIPKIEFKTNFGKITQGEPIVLKNIFFEFAKARLLPKSFPELNKLVALLKKHPQIQIKIQGHTDNVGTHTRNQQLSERRAQSVVNYLINKGVLKERLTAEGFGETKPIDTNQTKQGRQNNRRVAFVVL